METRQNNKVKTHQSISKTKIYKRNVSAVIDGTNHFASYMIGAEEHTPSGPCMVIGFPIVLLSYPGLLFTTTIGAGSKTIYDIYKRKPLDLDHVQQIIEFLKSLDSEANNKTIDELASAITEFQADSPNPSKLRMCLLSIESNKNKKIQHLKRRVVEECREAAKAKEKEEIDEFFKDKKFYQAVEAYNVNYQFSEEEKQKMKESITTHMHQILDKKRSEKINLIIDYLNAPNNAGKKLGNYIVRLVQQKMSEEVNCTHVSNCI